MLTITALLCTYVIASDFVFLGLSRLLKKDRVLSAQELFFFTRGVGPLVISWLMYNLFLFSPRQPPGYYVGVIGGLFVALFVWARRETPHLFAAYAACGQSLRRLAALRSFSLFLLACTTLICLFILFIGIAFPIVGHDSLVLAIEARIMRQDLSLEHFLNRVEPDSRSGYLPMSFQAPFLQMLYVWFSLVAGVKQMDILTRTVSPVFGLHCLILVGYLTRRRASLSSALWTMFLLAVTPLFLLMSYDNAQDTPRYYFALLALIWFAKLLEAQSVISLSWATVVGFFAGGAVYSHLLGAPAVAVGTLWVLYAGRASWRRSLTSVTLIVMMTVLVGTGYHYLASVPVREKLVNSLNLSRSASEWTALAKSVMEQGGDQRDSTPDGLDTAEEVVRNDAFQTLTEVRGQGRTPLQQFLFGRLQMFTGIEYFGFLFFLLCLASFAWVRKSSGRVTLDKLLFATTIAYCIVVLSGVRVLSWSNPRYIGSLMVIGAYFSGPLLAHWAESILRWKGWTRRVVVVLLIGFLSFPALLVTTIRGAKIGITNTGEFYSDFRSFRWLEAFLAEPGGAIRNFWQEYVGIRKTIRYAWASDEEKLKHAHDYLAAILYFNTHAPRDARALVLRDGRYFYYAQRYGIHEYDRRLRQGKPPRNVDESVELFASLGITHVLIDQFLETSPTYTLYRLGGMLRNPEISELVYEFGYARVYRLKMMKKQKEIARHDDSQKD
ncbi:MAG: glycosyltransferase family 39 protein [Candidatus Binatia bacterium]